MEKDDRYTRITLRIPRDLHAQLVDAADATSKSMNAEIVARLQDSFIGVPMPGSESALRSERDAKALAQQLQEIAQMFREMAKRLPKEE